MSFADAARLAVDSTFAQADAAEYTAVDAHAKGVKVLPAMADRIVDGFGDARLNAGGEAMFEVRASEVAEPQENDEFTITDDSSPLNGRAFRVARWEAKDSYRLGWVLECSPI